ncbi:protein YoaL [Pseudenterobacter timonensis]|uniref:protein YoaL n=1 Tax=Pseudenterobacter timonensis TaxID=1755099 RepID=UPI003CE5891C
MDRHRRQLRSRPFRASSIGDSRHRLPFSFFVSPAPVAAPFCHSFSRSFSWNS